MAHAAIASELNAQVRAPFLAAIREAIDPRQGALVGDERVFLLLALANGKRTPIEERISAHAARLVARGQSADLILRDAIVCVIEERVDAQRRACVGHALKVGGTEAQDLAVRIQKSADLVPFVRIASDIVAHGKVDTSSAKKPALDLDANLLKAR